MNTTKRNIINDLFGMLITKASSEHVLLGSLGTIFSLLTQVFKRAYEHNQLTGLKGVSYDVFEDVVLMKRIMLGDENAFQEYNEKVGLLCPTIVAFIGHAMRTNRNIIDIISTIDARQMVEMLKELLEVSFTEEFLLQMTDSFSSMKSENGMTDSKGLRKEGAIFVLAFCRETGIGPMEMFGLRTMNIIAKYTASFMDYCAKQ